MAARICPQCRTRVDERRAQGSPYCLSCGAPLGTPPPTGFGKPPVKGSALPWILGGVGVVLLLGIGGVVVVVIAVANAAPDKPVPTPDDPTSVPNLEVPTATASVPSAKPIVTATAKVVSTAPTAPRPPVTVVVPPPSASTPTVLGAFPRARATNELDRITAGLASCKRAGDPTGSGSIRVDFEPDGRVGTLLQRPFAGTPTGSCVSARFLTIRIGAFNGTTQQIQRTFTIPGSGNPGF
ncbi:MAG TPA: hypothetical protein VLT33_12535 [Labilithrix sp.]|nr:hypothetical protein [Labilithrix sp.]